MSRSRYWLAKLALALCIAIPCAAVGQTAPTGGTGSAQGCSSAQGGDGSSGGSIGCNLSKATCPNANFFSGMFSNLCWKCFFPVSIMGIQIGSGSSNDDMGSSNTTTGGLSGSPLLKAGESDDNVPDDLAAPICVCPGRTFGIPSIGETIGWWSPSHFFEVVRQPWCSPALGETLIDSNPLKATTSALSKKEGWEGLARWGGYAADPKQDQTKDVSGTFYNFHWWIYPAGEIEDALIGDLCTDKGVNSDMDFAYASEIDPTWINDEEALYTDPEAALFANPIAIAACMADSVMSSVSKPIRWMYWCAGTWGDAYPFTGNIDNNDDPGRNEALTVFKAIAALSRRTLIQKSYGDSAVCKDQINPMIQKQEFRLQRFFPVPEKGANQWLGSSIWRWGEWRNIPWKGEDFISVEWQYFNCCVTDW